MSASNSINRGTNRLTPKNKRLESRLPMIGLRVEVSQEKLGWGNSRLCLLVDLSLNGLSFVAHDNLLVPLDKIVFRVDFGDGTVEGKAVICYRQPEDDNGWRYGAMILAVSPEVETLLEDNELKLEEVRALAREMADRMVAGHCITASERHFMRSRLLLYEAMQVFVKRLEVMNYSLCRLVEVDLEQGVRIRMDSPLTVTAMENGSGYVSNQGDHFANVFEVLEFLRDQLTISQNDR